MKFEVTYEVDDRAEAKRIICLVNGGAFNFKMVGSTAELDHISTAGEINDATVQEVASNVEELPFVQAVTLDSEVEE